MSRRVFISDTHVSAGLGLRPDTPGHHPWEWFTEPDSQRFVAFLAWLGKRTTDAAVEGWGKVDEVVLIGDIFDNWVFPHDMKPPTFSELLASKSASVVIEALNGLPEETKVVYLPGNHDLTLSSGLVEPLLPNVTWGGDGVNDPYFSSGRLRAEHGNAHTLFCSPDPQQPGCLPLGYFISRMAATADRDTGSTTPSIVDVVREVGQLLEGDQLAHGVFDAICRKAGVNPEKNPKEPILMPGDLWGGRTVTVGEVRDLYAHLFTEWKRRKGEIEANLSIPAELGHLEPVADSMFLHGGVNAVVMGHTHRPMALQRGLPFLGKAAYANAGCWCNNVEDATWVEVEKRDDDTVSLSVAKCTGVDSGGGPAGIGPLFTAVTAGT